MSSFWDGMVVVVDRGEWQRAKAGDQAAVGSLRGKLHEVCIYDHCLYMGPGDWIGVTIRDVIDAGVVEAVTLHTRFYNQTPAAREPSSG